MHSPPERVSENLTESIVTSSRVSSSIINRLFRRSDSQSASKRSLSRKSLDNTLQSLQVSKFYVKMSTLNAGSDILEINRQKRLTVVDNSKNIKRRSPTPVAGRHRNPVKNSPKKDLDTELQLAELQKKVQDERIRKVAAERRAEIFEKQLRQKLKRIQELQEAIQSYKAGFQGTNQLLAQNKNQQRLQQSGIKRLRKNISQFRIQELELNAIQQNKQNNLLKMEIERLRIANQAYRDQCQILKDQIFSLSQRTGSNMIQAKQRQIQILRQQIKRSSTERQKYLDGLLSDYENDIQKLKDKVHHHELKIAFINRKKNQQLQQVADRKDKDIASIRKKLSSLARQSLEYRKQLESARRREGVLNNSYINLKSIRRQSISLSLSP